MLDQDMSRRALLKGGGAALAGLAAAGPRPAPRSPPSRARRSSPGSTRRRPRSPSPGLLDWEELDSWITADDQFFIVNHYGQPAVDAAAWRLASAAWSRSR